MKRSSFTLLELMIVIAVISVLITILLPSLTRARATAKFAVCRSNQSQHYRILMAGIRDNNGRIPRINNYGNSSNPEENLSLLDHDWYGAQSSSFTMVNPTMGLYTTSFEFLRCPSLEKGIKGSGTGSNGTYDYSLTTAFSIAFVAGIENESRWGTDWFSGRTVPTPIIMDEDPKGGINENNGEGGFCHSDKMDIRHVTNARKGSYATIEGSVFTYEDPKSPEFRTFDKFFSGLPNDRFDKLVWPTTPYNGIDSNMVWQKRPGIGDQ